MTIEITKELLWKIADGDASEEELLAVHAHAVRILQNQFQRRENLDNSDPVVRVDDMQQEAWLKLQGWCKSFPRDGLMGVDQWIRVCWRNVSVNMSEYAARRRPRNWVSLEGIRDKAREEGKAHADEIAPNPPNLNEVWKDLCTIVDHIDMPPKIKRRMKQFLGLRLHGYSVAEACIKVKYFTDPQGEIFRKHELLVITEYLGHKPLSR